MINGTNFTNITSLNSFREKYFRSHNLFLDPSENLFSEKGKVLVFSKPVVSGEFYRIGMDEIIKRTSKEYIDFLREAGYFEGLPRCLEIGKDLLRINNHVRDVAGKIKLNLEKDNEYYISGANQCDARVIINSLGGRLLTVGLMYKVFIPFLMTLSKNGDEDTRKTINAMRSKIYGEFLEDIIVDNKKIVICAGEKLVSLPEKNTIFNISDLDEYGYPKEDYITGSFDYFPSKNPESAVVRGYKLGLNLGHSTNSNETFTGMRFARFV